MHLVRVLKCELKRKIHVNAFAHKALQREMSITVSPDTHFPSSTYV